MKAVLIVCGSIITACVISLLVTDERAQAQTPWYVVTRNHFGAPTLCWPAETHPKFFGNNWHITWRGVPVYIPTFQTFVSPDPGALGIDPTKCTGGHYAR